MCEDWFHNQHMLPPMLSKGLNEDFILLCRTCLKNHKPSQIACYVDFMEPTCQKVFQKLFKIDLQDPKFKENTTSAKRIKLDESHEVVNRKCSDEMEGYDDQRPALDIIINYEFLSVSCQCEAC